MNRPIRQQLTIWYIGILAVILSLFGLALYWNVAATLHRDVDKTLLLQADATASAVSSFRKAEETSSTGRGNWQGAPALSFMGEIQRGQLPELLARWARKTEGLEKEHSVRIVDRYGEVLVASKYFIQRNIPLNRAALKGALEGRTSYETLRLPERVRLMTRPILRYGHALYLIQVATPLAQVDTSVKRFGIGILWLIPLTLALASSVGWFLATAALEPVGDLVSRVKRITAQHLDERIHVPQTEDELEQLAVTFNEMLGRLERAFRQLRQFSAAASHELRTPLTAMRGELEVALRRPRTAAEYEEVLRSHLKEAERLSAIVEDLLTLAHSEVAEKAVDKNPVELGELALEVSEAWQKIAQEKSVRLEVRIAGPAWIQGERRLLERLVSNLLDNAIKHTPPLGHVLIAIDRLKNGASFAVSDTGPGISPEDLPYIFDRFFARRENPSDGTTPPAGLGLGLCRWIAEAHHGRIEVSKGSPEGSVFTVLFPAVSPR